MASFPHLPLELICMVLVQLMLSDPPRIFHLKCKPQKTFPYLLQDFGFHGNMGIAQPLVAHLSPWFRDWAKKYYVLVFASETTKTGYIVGGLWIRRCVDLVYIDNAFINNGFNGISLRLLTPSVSFANVSKVAVDATLLNEPSMMRKLLVFFPNVENMVPMAPTQSNPPHNRYRGLRLVDEQEEEDKKQLPFTNFYHCGAIVTNVSQNKVMISRSPDAISDTHIRTCLGGDMLRGLLVAGSPLKVILFQRQGMRAPTQDIVTGPKRSINSALSKIAWRMRSVPISVSELLDLVEESKTKSRPSGTRAQINLAILRPSEIKNRIW